MTRLCQEGSRTRHYCENVDAASRSRFRTVMTVLLGVAVFPLSAVPLWALGNVADDYNADGGFAVGQALVLAPAVGTMVVARSWAEWRWLPTLALSIACFLACGIAMLVAFVIVLPLFLDSL